MKNRTTDEIIDENVSRVKLFGELKNPLAQLREMVFDGWAVLIRLNRRVKALEAK